MRVLFLTTHYENEAEVRRFIAHVTELPRPQSLDLNFCVTDNSRSWHASPPLADNVAIITPSRNLGYLNGCHDALETSAWRDLADWVFVANTDLTLDDNFLLRLANRSRSSDTGVLAPAITRSDGLEQNPHFRSRPSVRRMRSYLMAYRFRFALTILESVSRWKAGLRRGRNCATSVVPATEGSIYAAHGSLFGLSREFFNRGGRLQYASFLYGEEIHIAEQARSANLSVCFDPTLIVTHHAKAVTGRLSSGQRRRWKYESLSYLFRTYFQTSHTSRQPLTEVT